MAVFSNRFCVVALLLFLSPLAWSDTEPQTQTSWSKWQEARTLYDAGKFEEALHALRSSPIEDASYYYNLGNIHYRLGQLGLAAGNLEKANRMRAHDPDIQYNLKTVREVLGKTIGEENLDPASSWLEAIADRIPIDEIRGTFGLIAFIITLLWLRAYWKSRDLKKTLFRPAGLLSLLALCLIGSLYFAQRLAMSYPPAICIENQTVRSGPGDQFIDLSRLTAGVKIRLLGPTATSGVPGSTDGATEMWRQVRYTKGGIGWVRASSLLLL